MNAESKAVFLSYASQDADAARKICETLRAAGVEVWFDADGGLEHGDEWDAKIRRQIKECVLFIPIISAHTQARLEGYFRIEWALAAERAVGIADGVPFVLPVVIDDTREPEALVPDRFRKVQWMRLPQGVVTPSAQQRLLKLWSHRTGVLRHETATAADVAERSTRVDVSRGAGAAARLSRHRGLVVSAFVGAALVAAAAIWQPWKRDRPSTGAAASVKATPRASRPEVATLLARVHSLSTKIDVVRTELDTAVGLLEQAAKVDATDANIWAEWALLDRRYVVEVFDRSRARLDLARRHATQAMGLDPANPMARLADAATMVLLNSDAPTQQAAIALLEPLANEITDDGSALLLLASLKWDGARPDLVSSYFDRVGRIPGWTARAEIQRSWLHFFSSQFQQAEDAVDRGLAAERAAYLFNWKACFLICWHGDAAAAQRVMTEIPAPMMVEDFFGSGRFFVDFRARDYDRAVAALRAVPRDYIESIAFAGPTGYFNGSALARAGKTAAAEIEWRSGLETVNRKLVTAPNDHHLLLFKALLLAALGQTTDSEKVLRATRELYGSIIRTWPQYFAMAELDPPETALAQLADMVNRADVFATAGSLRLDPFLDRLRSHPKFVELLAKAEADPRLSPKAQAVAKAGNPTGAAGAADKSVAVLAFANLSDDKTNEYFSDGIADELLTVLQKIPGLKVAARTSAFSFKGKNVTAQEVGEKLGMAHVVDGSVQKSDNRVKITARLSRAATNEELWSKSFGPLQLTDVFVTQSEIAQTVVGELRGLLTGEALTTAKAEIQLQVISARKGGTKNVEAHQLYLRGRFLANEFSQENFARAVEYFRQAVDRDPSFALAWAALSRAHAVRWSWGALASEGEPLMREARQAANRALALEPELAEAHAASFEAQIAFEFDWRGAQASARKALALAPSDAANIGNAAKISVFAGNVERGIELFRQALALDPSNTELRILLGSALHDAGRLGEAVAEYRRTLAINPSAAVASGFVSYDLARLGRLDEALAPAEREPESWTRHMAFAVLHWARKKQPEADAALRRFIELHASDAAYNIAEVYGFRGDVDQAFAWLERAYRQRDAGIGWTKVDRFFQTIRTDPRWPALLRKFGLADEQLP